MFSEIFYTDYFTHIQLGYEFPLTGQQTIALSWNIDTQAAGINYNSRYATLGLSTDKLDYKKAQALSMMIGFNIPF